MFAWVKIDIRVEDKTCIVIFVVGFSCLDLPNGLALEFKDDYFVTLVLRNIIYVFVLDTLGYHFTINNRLLSFSLNGIHYLLVWLMVCLFLI